MYITIISYHCPASLIRFTTISQPIWLFSSVVASQLSMIYGVMRSIHYHCRQRRMGTTTCMDGLWTCMVNTSYTVQFYYKRQIYLIFPPLDISWFNHGIYVLPIVNVLTIAGLQAVLWKNDHAKMKPTLLLSNASTDFSSKCSDNLDRLVQIMSGAIIMQSNISWHSIQHCNDRNKIEITELILGLHPANERCHKVAPSLIGWAQT